MYSTLFITEILQIVDGPHDLNTIEDQQALFKVELDTEATKFKVKWFKGDQELKTDKKYKIESYGNFAVLKVMFLFLAIVTFQGMRAFFLIFLLMPEIIIIIIMKAFIKLPYTQKRYHSTVQ